MGKLSVCHLSQSLNQRLNKMITHESERSMGKEMAKTRSTQNEQQPIPTKHINKEIHEQQQYMKKKRITNI